MNPDNPQDSPKQPPDMVAVSPQNPEAPQHLPEVQSGAPDGEHTLKKVLTIVAIVVASVIGLAVLLGIAALLFIGNIFHSIDADNTRQGENDEKACLTLVVPATYTMKNGCTLHEGDPIDVGADAGASYTAKQPMAYDLMQKDLAQIAQKSGYTDIKVNSFDGTIADSVSARTSNGANVYFTISVPEGQTFNSATPPSTIQATGFEAEFRY